jgi:ketosteroid isomerase-like protein
LRIVSAVARWIASLRSGDLPGVGSYFADDVVWEAPDTLPTGGVIRGRDAVLEQSRVERWEGRQASCFTCSRW